MKLLCLAPKASAGLFGGRTYTAVGGMRCERCGKAWFEIVEAQHDDLGRHGVSSWVCSNCNADLVAVTEVSPERERHMFDASRFVPIDPPEVFSKEIAADKKIPLLYVEKP